MAEAPRYEQTGSFKVRDDEGHMVEVVIFSRFIDVTNMRTTGGKREWSENAKKRYYGPNRREGDFVKGTIDKFVFVDDPDRVYTKIE